MHAPLRFPVHRLIALCLMLAIVALPAFAADAPKKDKAAAEASKAKAEHEAMMVEMMKYANPGPMHELLKPLAGNWKTTQKMWMGPGEPTVSEGTSERTWVLGGRFLQSKYNGNFANMPFEGMELLGYDTRKKEYTSVWIDNMGTMFSISTGKTADPSAKTITLNGSMDDPLSGKPMPYKMTTRIVDENTHVFTMTCNKDGKEMNQMEITYTRTVPTSQRSER